MLTETSLRIDALILIRIGILIVAILGGCQSSDQPLFDLKAEDSSLSESKILWALRSTALPPDTDTSQGLEEADLPAGSLYLMVVPDPFDSNLFRVDVKAQNLTGIYDTPMTLAYDPSLVEVLDSNSGVQIVEGSPESRLRKEFEPGLGLTRLSVLLAAKDPDRSGRIIISQSLLVDLGRNQNYQGSLFSIPMRILSVSNFKTTLGFEISSSQVLDRDGASLEVTLFGGTMTRNL